MRRALAQAYRLPPCSVALALLLVSCVGTEIGNPQDEEVVTSQLRLGFSGYEHASSGTLTLKAGIEVTRAWLSVESIELRSAEDCESGQAVLIDGPFAADLLSDVVRPAMPATRLPWRSLCTVRLRLSSSQQRGLPDGAPVDLDTASVLIEGRFEQTPFILRASFQEMFVLVPRSGSIALEAGDDPLLIGIALDTLLTPALFEGRPPSEGVIQIDMLHNQAALAMFRRDLRRSLRLFRDTDGDRRANPLIDTILAEGEL